MVNEAEPPGGLDAHSAFLEFTDEEKFEVYEHASMAVPSDPRFELTGILDAHSGQGEGWEGLGPFLKRRRPHDYKTAELEAYLIAKRHARDAKKPACHDFGEQLRRGKIVAFGSPDPEGATKRSRLDASLWDTLRARTRRAWHKSRFSGGGLTFYDVRFHNLDVLKVWRAGAPLEFAIRATVPLEWANYKAFWSPEHAPEHFGKKDQRNYGESDRTEFWRGLLESLSEHGLELRLLSPPNDAAAKWIKPSADVQGVLVEAEAVDLERSTVTLTGKMPMKALVFIAGRFSDAEIEEQSALDHHFAHKSEFEHPSSTKSKPRREVGRPSRREEIEAAFERLRDGGALCDCQTLTELYPLIRVEVCKAARNDDEIELDDETGLGDEAIRKVVSSLFKDYRKSHKSRP